MGPVDRKTLLWLGLGALIGLALGLAIGWWWWPVQWVNAYPTDLAPGYQDEYVAMVADSYALTSDAEAARRRLEGWPEARLREVLGRLHASHQAAGRSLEARRIQELSAALNVPLAPVSTPTPAPARGAGVTLGRVLSICGIFLAVVLLLGGAALGVSYWRRRQVPAILRGRRAPRPAEAWEVPPEPTPPVAREQPQRVFLTTYTLGDDAYDESFSIDSPTGEFLGECGVSISEVIGTGAPDKVCAFEVWLFDRNDIKTVTKVLMSDHAYHDSAIRARQSTKGEVILAAPGKEFTLETASLQVRVRVLEMEYGVDDAPADSFFSKLTLQMTAQVKAEESLEEPSV
jgi:hypothetical protein